MAGDWIKIEHTLPDKPEVIRMAVGLRIDQDAVVGKLVRVWGWADQNTVDGQRMAITEAFLDRLVYAPGFAAALREAGWLDGKDGALTFPAFDRHNGSTAKARAETNRRVANHRQRNARTVTNVTSPALPNTLQKPLPEKRREEKKEYQDVEAPRRGGPAAAAAAASDAEWLAELKIDPAYQGIDVDREHARCARWCQVRRKHLTRRRFVNWLNGADIPLAGANGHLPHQPRQHESI